MSIHSIILTNEISMNDDDNYIHNCYAQFLSSNNHEDLISGTEYDSEKRMVCHQKNVMLDFGSPPYPYLAENQAQLIYTYWFQRANH